MIPDTRRDLHVLRYFSSFISVSSGKVVWVSDPAIAFCPLAGRLYRGLKDAGSVDKETLKQRIKEAIESKIRDYGFFTSRRELQCGDTAIPFGASEMIMSSLKRKAVDAAVVVCDGAGTVVTDSPEAAQGIGARMNSLLLTSPIKETMARLEKMRCRVVSPNALIDQRKGVELAAGSGYKRIVVTVSGHDSGQLESIRQLESDRGVSVTVLVVCTTGISADKLEEVRRHADVVWSCASEDVRQKIGAAALMQISKAIPVFVLTPKGSDFVAAYAGDPEVIRGLGPGRQYFVSQESGGQKVRLGSAVCFVREERLPVLSAKSFSTITS